MQILFVCTGNICRSPTAERLAAALGVRLGLPDFSASSAGLQAVIGHGMHRDAALVLEGLGGDASGFSARQLTPKVAERSDLILTMTMKHRDTVLERMPRLLKRTFTMHEAALLAELPEARSIADLGKLRSYVASEELTDVPDPIGESLAFFESVGNQIVDLLPPILGVVGRSASGGFA